MNETCSRGDHHEPANQISNIRQSCGRRGPGGPAWAASKTGWLCEACTSVEAAREQARLHAPPLQCNTTVGDTGQPVLDPDATFECQAPPAKQVVLGNREWHQVYVFEVKWQLNGQFW